MGSSSGVRTPGTRMGVSGKITRPGRLWSVSARAFAMFRGNLLWQGPFQAPGQGQAAGDSLLLSCRAGESEARDAGRKTGHPELRGPTPLLPLPPCAVCLGLRAPSSHRGECLHVPRPRWPRGRRMPRKHRGRVPVSLPGGKLRAGVGTSLRPAAPGSTRRHRAPVGRPCWLPLHQERHSC